MEKFFDATTVEMTIEGERKKQYLKYTNLAKMRDWNIIAKVRRLCDLKQLILQWTFILDFIVELDKVVKVCV